MTKRKSPITSVTKSKDYIKAKASGMSKKDALIYAGYTGQTVRVPNIIERTGGYQIALQQIIATNAETLNMSVSQFTERVIAGELSLTTMKDHAEIISKLAKIHDTLNPKVKLEMTDEQGNKATKWQTINNTNN